MRVMSRNQQALQQHLVRQHKHASRGVFWGGPMPTSAEELHSGMKHLALW